VSGVSRPGFEVEAERSIADGCPEKPSGCVRLPPAHPGSGGRGARPAWNADRPWRAAAGPVVARGTGRRGIFTPSDFWVSRRPRSWRRRRWHEACW